MTIKSFEDQTGQHCVDIQQDSEGGYSFKIFRKDPEDQGRWTLVADYSALRYRAEDEALRAAALKAPWLKS